MSPRGGPKRVAVRRRYTGQENSYGAARVRPPFVLWGAWGHRLAFIDGLSQREIAERLSLPLGTVKSRVRLAYENMRDALRDLK
jgi:Sigma-70, region 4